MTTEGGTRPTDGSAPATLHDATAAPSPSTVYQQRAAQFSGQRDAFARRSRLLSNARLAVFLLLIVLALLLERAASLPLIGAAVAAAALFIALVALHRGARSRERWFDALASLNREGLDRIARDWDRLPVRTPGRPIGDHPYATDLDLYGRASLSQILGPVATPIGSDTLDQWLLAHAAPDVIAPRQAAVRELAPRNELRDSLALHGRAARTIRQSDIDRFLDWAESPGWALENVALRAAAWFVPLALWGLVAAQALDIIDRSWWILPAIIAFIAYVTIGARARRTFDRAFSREPLFEYYPEMVRAVTRSEFTSRLLNDVRQRLTSHDVPADEQIGRLARLMHAADLRLSTMHLPVFLVTMWDLHVLFALERWQRDAGRAVRDWLVALGEAEALAALATLAHDQPAWAFPLVNDDDAVYAATALGHPLIPDGTRIHNDVIVGPPGSFLLITGSNMSGKSTLLRAIGANAVLAQAGAPVCASSMRMPPLDVQTSIRVQDSLARGVSYFMAELERLKQITQSAQAAVERGPRVLFLLDEILHGTNTAERRIAATRVIRHLVETGALGAATTHDLSLADDDALADVAQLVHFTETVNEVDGAMTLHFDYRLRDGIATSTNALALMRIVGLG